jgi:processive 1,2-diacylglycerol beta-glucosyltransferase
MIQLYDNNTQTVLGEITEQQLQFLIDQLEEESSDDQDYYINRATLEMFAEAGIDPALLALLQQGLGNRADMEIRWARS